MKDCTTCKYGYEDERLDIPMCHHPKRFSEDCVNFNMHEEKETEESEKPINLDDAMKELDEKIALVKKRGTWDRVDVDKYMDEVRGRESENPVPKDLEEAANKFAVFYDQGTCDGIAQECFIAGAVWQKEQDEKDLSEKIAAAYQLGLADKEKQMLKEAVDTIVEDWNPDPEPEITIPLNPEEFTCGDKVRVIVCKKED